MRRIEPMLTRGRFAWKAMADQPNRPRPLANVSTAVTDGWRLNAIAARRAQACRWMPFVGRAIRPYGS